jgi:peroxiredoxin Q/BCP
MSQELKEGDSAPEFDLPVWTMDGPRELALSSLKGKTIVLYFYPKDDTPGCTAEACSFRDALQALRDKNAVVIGISPDDLNSHEEFAHKFSLPFPLLADANGAVAKKYGCWIEKTMNGKKYMGVDRTTFLIDTHGVIRKIWHKVTPQGHADVIIQAIAESNARL